MGITITPQKGCWINYQLRLNSITQAAVAEKAGCNNRMVSDFLRGRKNSHCLIINLTQKVVCLKIKI